MVQKSKAIVKVKSESDHFKILFIKSVCIMSLLILRFGQIDLVKNKNTKDTRK